MANHQLNPVQMFPCDYYKSFTNYHFCLYFFIYILLIPWSVRTKCHKIFKRRFDSAVLTLPSDDSVFFFFQRQIFYCHTHSTWLLAVNIGLRHPAGGGRWYVFKNAKWHLMFSVASCFPDPGWTWPSAPLVRWNYAFGSAHSSSIGLHLKGHPVLSDFSPLESLRQWHYKNNNMLSEGGGGRSGGGG